MEFKWREEVPGEGGDREAGPSLGARLEHLPGPGALGRRAAQHVEANPSGEFVGAAQHSQ